ncbi:MAG: type I toxin-antitoxin system SymE family toxin [Pseudomonas indica]|nr:SymE family type I addiction module toxin [Pseudomonas indica]MBU3056825.1 type I toxin-antitoxin system SymE family toxin [Pseudomonas indica]
MRLGWIQVLTPGHGIDHDGLDSSGLAEGRQADEGIAVTVFWAWVDERAIQHTAAQGARLSAPASWDSARSKGPLKGLLHSSIYRPPVFGTAARGTDHSGDRLIPGIKPRGYWLQQAGFEVNEKRRIRVMQGCLVITAEKQ